MAYLVLVSRNKSNVKVVTRLRDSGLTHPSPLQDLASLQMPVNWTQQVSRLLRDNRLLYEAVVYPSATYQELKECLRQQGYQHVPNGESLLLDFRGYSVLPPANLSGLKVRKSMIRKAK